MPVTLSLKETVDVHKVAAFIEPSMSIKYVPAFELELVYQVTVLVKFSKVINEVAVAGVTRIE